ncbi:MAG: DEAD/DEAH box helicase [Balneolaceae bacterium]
MTFNDLDLHEELKSGLRDIGYTKPTPIQEKSIPIILSKKDMIGAAQTGTGKTGAFVIPVLEQILQNKSEHTQALILSPTRELAQQIDEQIFALGYHTGLSSATIIGGEDFAKQANAIRAGVDLIVATPGRLIDQTKVLDIDFSHIKFLVLDEADRMLDMGFMPDVTKIIKKLPKERQTLLFSATMPGQIKDLAREFMNDPEKVEIEIAKPSESISQRAYHVDSKEKLNLVQHILDDLKWESCIIFCATKRGTDELERLLTKKGIKAGSIHGDRTQDERNKALHDFKNGVMPVIVATDVLARGIDIADVSLIMNYDVPRAVDDYIHRIGRTGRYDKSGMAITLVSKKDNRAFQAIQDKVGDQLEVLEAPSKQGKVNKTISKAETKEPPKRKPVPKSKSHPENKKEIEKVSEKKASSKKTAKKKKSLAQIRKEVENLDSVSVKLKSSSEDKSEKNKVENLESVSVKLKSSSNAKEEKKRGAKKAPENTSTKKHGIPAERIKKATYRNQKTRKPAKGVWGVLKSLIPKFSKK